MNHGHHHHGASGGDLIIMLLPLLLLATYLWGALREERWSRWRILAFAAGCVTLSLALTPAVSHWAHSDLRGHMVQHLLLGMYAPIGLVLGAPGTLFLRGLPTEGARRLTRFLGSATVRVITHPWTAAILDIGAMFVLYLTPLYTLSLQNDALHLWLHLHFVLAGCLFTWAIAGPDPAPHRPSRMLRLWVLFAASAAHAILGKLMYGHGFPRGTGATEAELQAAAQWMYYGGDVAGIALAIMLLADWFAARRRRFTAERGGSSAIA